MDISLVGTVVPSVGDPYRGEVRIAGGRIESVGPDIADAGSTRRIDVGAAYLLPGLVDCHVHCLSDPGEGIEAATRSAAAGGVTTIVEMPFDGGGPLNSPERYLAKVDKVGREAWIDVALLGTVKPQGGAADVAGLVDAGVVGFKLSLFHTDPDRFPRLPDDQLLDVFTEIARADSTACVHAENDEIIKARIASYRAEGRTSPRDHPASRPPVSETEAVGRACELALAAGARLHLCHVSVPRSVDVVDRFRGDGLDVTVETCPHYLVFTEADMDDLGARLKINPPLRTAEDQEGLWQRLAAGRLTAVSSDHAPWPVGNKTKENVFDNHSGAPGVETLAAVMAGAALDRGLDIDAVARLLSTNPARRFGLTGKGSLAPGADGDITVIDPDQKWTVDEAELHSNAGWSPYHGYTTSARVTLTVSRGEVVWDGSSLQGSAGRGRLVSSRA